MVLETPPRWEGDTAKSLDSKDICTACFVIDLSQALSEQAFVLFAGEFFTKLSTEIVHQREKWAAAGWAARTGAEWSITSEGRTLA
jgi:hypothetical protein